MRTQAGNRRGAGRLHAAVLSPAAILLTSTVALGLPQQTSSTQSTQPATGTGAGQPTAASPGAITSTRAISQSRIDQRGQVLTNRGQINPSNAPVAGAAVSGQSTAAVTSQNQALLRDFNVMAARLDQMIATLDTSSGAQRSETLVVVVQEMAAQLAEMRRLLLGASLGTFEDGIGEQAVFITPSGSAQTEIRRLNGLDEPLVTNTASRTGTVVIQSPVAATSGLDRQAANRRTGQSDEPLTDPED